jgi:single stranded DNA-binding protein
LPASVLVHAAWARNRTRAKEGAMDLNIVAITGRLAADPELHSTGNGTDVTTLRIAVGRMRRQGEQRTDADFVDVVVWGEQAKHAGRYLAKGRRVAIKGRPQQRTWTTPDGAKRSRLAAERGIQRIRSSHHLAFSFLRHCGLSHGELQQARRARA